MPFSGASSETKASIRRLFVRNRWTLSMLADFVSSLIWPFMRENTAFERDSEDDEEDKAGEWDPLERTVSFNPGDEAD